MVYQWIPFHYTIYDFEVDSTESVWYTRPPRQQVFSRILKLTPQSQYGINFPAICAYLAYFEVDSTESVWYNLEEECVDPDEF